jgi:hypothetical protein
VLAMFPSCYFAQHSVLLHPAEPLDTNGLEPAAVWRNFAAVSAIPRPTGHLDGWVLLLPIPS